MPQILIVEDEHDMLEDLVAIFELEGFDVVAVENGRAALEAALREKPDVILSDIRMPEMNGIELLREIRSRPDMADIPFIFHSAYHTDEYVTLANGAGADDFLAKPTAIDKMIETVRSYL